MSNNVEQIKERLSIVDVVESYIKLQKAGVNFKACCPFHNEKTPSFVVSPIRGTYHCFGCGKGGDIFSFVEEMEGLDFKGALKILADRAGVVLVHQNPQKKEKKDRLYELMNEVATFYQINLTKNKEAIAYLYKRGLKPGTLKDFRIGFAEDSWEDCFNFLKSKSYSDAEIEEAGLIIKKQNNGASSRAYYDRFRSRIMFPITDAAGRVVAFSGRIFGKEDENTGKYINSPETELYHKSSILFGYDKAKSFIRRENACVLVEGHIDLLMAHQAGTENSVAISGTAFTDEHATMIDRLAERLVLALDGDSAGLAATGKSALKALAKGLDVRVAVLQKDKDPADIILEDVERWKKMIKDSSHVVDFYLNVLEKQFEDRRAFKLEVAKRVLPLIKQIKNKIDQAHFIDVVSKRLGVDRTTIKEEMKDIEHEQIETHKNHERVVSNNETSTARKEKIEKSILGLVLWQESEKNPAIDTVTYRERVKKIVGEGVYKRIFDETLKSEKQKYIFEIESKLQDGDIVSEAEELVTHLLVDVLQDKRRDIQEKLQRAEDAQNETLVDTLLKDMQQVSKEIDENK